MFWMVFAAKKALPSSAAHCLAGNCAANAERGEGIAQGLYYKWSKDFLEAGKKRLAGDIVRQANTSEVKNLRQQTRDLKEVVAEQTLELRLLKKSMIGNGGDDA